jgi:hypothetical protein
MLGMMEVISPAVRRFVVLQLSAENAAAAEFRQGVR